MRYTLRPATQADVLAVLADVRPEDRREWEDATGRHLEPQLREAVETADVAFTVLRENTPLLIFGVDFVSNFLGQAWLVATEGAKLHSTSLHSVLEEALFLIDSAFPATVAYADPRNAVHIVWLERMGWQHVANIRTGPHGLTYSQYERPASYVHRRRPARPFHGGGDRKLGRPVLGRAV